VTNETEGKCLGLVGGLGPGATIHYYRELIDAHAARRHVPRLLITHADVSRVLRDAGSGNLQALAQYLAQLIRPLADAGAQVAAIAAITPHICVPDLVKLLPLPLVDLIAEVAHTVQARGLTRVAVFGTRVTVESQLFGRLDSIEVIPPKPDELDYIHNTYVEIVQTGRGSEAQAAGLRRIAHTLCERDGAEAIVLAGTELALVFNDRNTDFPAIDCARVHVDAIMSHLIR
jgi:aspartate racemase